MIKVLVHDLKILLLAAFLILFCMYSGNKPISIDTLIGLALLIAICMAGLRLRTLFSKLNFPALAWVSTISLIICLPSIPYSEYATRYINAVDFLSITTPILAFAGISVSNKMLELKKLSWKIFIVAFFVFGGRLILSAVISQTILSYST
jgi:hypothetical protein